MYVERNSTMKACIDEAILAKYPALRIGVVVARGITNAPSRGDLQLRKQSEAADFRDKYSSEDLAGHPAHLHHDADVARLDDRERRNDQDDDNESGDGQR